MSPHRTGIALEIPDFVAMWWERFPGHGHFTFALLHSNPCSPWIGSGEFQENELFSSTIKENVAYGAELNEEKVIDALQKANIWEYVKSLPNGIDTEVGERGVKLSGGQRQRVQIARAIYKDAPILILDEATSSLDAKSESEVSEAVDNLIKGRMVIVIAHRFSTIQNANKIIVLNDKKVEAMGTPQDLANKPGIYSDLLKYQIDGNKKLLKKFEIY